MSEFTGERVVPGAVEPDLWNEHFARYLFGGRLARGKRVLDLACGTGYGAAELARSATTVYAVDVAPDAVSHARCNYPAPNLHFLQADCRNLPFRDASIDLIIAFELIEHLRDATALLAEARRLLSPSGQLVISTPNIAYYNETRRLHGPNPFHEHEFTYDEFEQALRAHFPQVSLFVQNHSDSIVFQPVTSTTSAEIRLESKNINQPGSSHFFVAVCALRMQIGSPTFVYLPKTANVLREREEHIAKLEAELATKTRWLDDLRQQYKELVDRARELTAEIEEKNRWAQELDAKLAEATTGMAEKIRGIATAYEDKIAELEGDIASKVEWARQVEARLGMKSQELAECIEMLHRTERDLEERTAWALALDKSKQHLELRLNRVQASRWYRLGRKIGLGPEVRDS